MERCFRIVPIAFTLTLFFNGISSELISDINVARQYLRDFDKMAADIEYQSALAEWAYETNITDFNRERQVIFLFI